MSKTRVDDTTANAIQTRLMAIFAGSQRTFTTVLIGFSTREQLVSPSISGKASKILCKAALRGSTYYYKHATIDGQVFA